MLTVILAVVVMLAIVGLTTYKQVQPSKLERVALELGIEAEII